MIGFFGLDDSNPRLPTSTRSTPSSRATARRTNSIATRAPATRSLNFTNADRYRPSQAKDAWEKMLAFLGRHLKK